MASPFISDGYTEKGYLAPYGEIPAIRFSYRPTTRAQLNAYLERVGGKKESAAGAIEADELAKKITEWSIADDSGAQWPIKPENLLRLRSPVYNRLAQIVLYGAMSDADPEAPQPDDSEVTRILEAATGVEGSQKN